MIYWACKRCAEGLEAPECLAGERLRCPKCKRLCRVPQAIEHHEADVALVTAGGATEVIAAESTTAPIETNGHAAHEAFADGVAPFDLSFADHTEPPADFAISRVSNEADALLESPEVPDSIAADDADSLPVEEAENRLPMIDATADIAASAATPEADLAEDDHIVETEIVIERIAANGTAHDATMDDLISDAMDRELTEHPPANGTHEEAAIALDAVSDTSIPSLAEPPVDEVLTPEQELERSLEDVTPLIQRQLGPAIAQYSSREQAKAAMFARAIVDVYPIRLNVRSHEPGRIALAVRYRRILRRTMIGTKTLNDLTVEATFVNNAGSWSLSEWHRILAV